MVSAAEQLAANLNFGALAKAEELKKRIWFTLGALLVYRLGTYIPLPGIDPSAWDQIFRSQAGGILGMFNMFSGGGIHRMAIFALNIMPYISASIIIQLMTTVSPTLEQLKKEGEQGRKVMNQYTRYLTVLLAAFQSYGIAVGLEGAGNVVTDPGWFFRIGTVITLTGGTMFLMWLGEQITSRGIGNGISLIILSGIRADPAGPGDGGRGDRLHRVHGAGAAATVDPVSQAPGRQPHVRGAILAPAAQAQHVGCHPADFRLLASAATDHRGQLQCRPGAGMAVHHHHAARARPALVPVTLCRPHHLLRLLLHGDRLQPDGDGRKPQEARGLRPRHPARRAHRRIHRSRALAHHRGRSRLSRRRLSHSRNPDRLCGGAVLFRWHLAPDRGERHHGYGGADPGLSPGPPV